MSDTMLNELSSLLGYDVTADSREMSEVFASTHEMQNTYQEKEPYTTAKTLVGDRYVWTESFINKVLYSLSTDDLSNMNTSEYQVMIGFIEFENRHSTNYTKAQETVINIPSIVEAKTLLKDTSQTTKATATVAM